MNIKDNFKKLKIILATIWGFSIIWIIYSASKTEGSILVPIIISSILLVVLGITHFGKKFSELSKKQTKDDIPNPIERQEILDVVKTIINGTSENDYGDGYFRDVKDFSDVRTEDVNKQQISAVNVSLSYKRKFGKEEPDKLWVIINTTYPSIMASVMNGNLPYEEIKKEMELKTKADPKAEPTIYEETFKNDMLGTEKFTKKTTPAKEEKKEEEEKVL